MRRRQWKVALFGAALALGVLSSGCDKAAATESSGAADPPAFDEAGVNAVATAWDAAWNAGDSRAIGALFTDDAEFINGRGQLAVGAAAIAAQHGANLAGAFRGSHIQGRIRRVTFLSATVAVLDVDSELTGYVSLPPGTVATEPGIQRGRHKRVVVKRGGKWFIQLMQITTVAPTAG
jgi:uncharacterized protein (TIGR02246 family)